MGVSAAAHVGVCLNNSLAVWQGLRTRGGAFERTPKFRVERTHDRWRSSNYALPLDRIMIAELMLAFYALGAAWLVAGASGWFSALFMLLYAASFTTVVGVSLWQNQLRQQRKHQLMLRPTRPRRADEATRQPTESVLRIQ